MNGNKHSEGAWTRYMSLVLLTALVALAGYAGYVLYPRFDLSAAQGMGLLGLATAAGVASFFSPCSFPLLVALLGRQGGGAASNTTSPTPIRFGAALALGAAAFLVLTGAAIAFGGQSLFSEITFTSGVGIFIRIVVGVLLIALGLIQTGILPLSMHGVSRLARPLMTTQARLRRERPMAGFALFGFGYVLAGFG